MPDFLQQEKIRPLGKVEKKQNAIEGLILFIRYSLTSIYRHGLIKSTCVLNILF